jgi:hypothetical protein
VADRPHYRLELEALPSEFPAVNRLRAFLKMALRAYRLRCVDAREIDPEGHERAVEQEPSAPEPIPGSTAGIPESRATEECGAKRCSEF